jgi:hypothetical protein
LFEWQSGGHGDLLAGSYQYSIGYSAHAVQFLDAYTTAVYTVNRESLVAMRCLLDS